MEAVLSDEIPEAFAKPQSKRRLHAMLCLAILSGFAAFASQIYAIAVERQLYLDGGAHLFSALEYRFVANDGWRYSTKLAYVLPYVITRFTDNVSLAIFSFGFYLVVELLVSFALCFAVLKRVDRVAMMCFPLMSFAAGTMTTLVFSSIGLIDTAVAFWPAFLAICFWPRISWLNFTWLAALIIFIGLSHEAAIFCLAVLTFVAFARISKIESRQGRQTFLALGLLAIAAMVGCVYRSYYGPYPTGFTFTYFFVNFFSIVHNDAILEIVLVNLLLFTLALFTPLRLFYLLVLQFLLSAYPILKSAAFSVNPNSVVPERPLVTVTMAAVAFAMWLYNKLGYDFPTLSRRLANATIIALVLLFAGSVRDFFFSQSWQEGVSIIRNLISAENRGCAEIPDPVFLKLTTVGFDPYFLPELSILLQHDRQPKTVFFVKSPAHPCDAFRNEGVLVQLDNERRRLQYGWTLPQSGYFEFTKSTAL